MTRAGESVESITVPQGDPEALEGSATQLRAVAGQLNESAARLAAMPSLLSNWAGPGSSQFALLSGQQAGTVQSSGTQVSMAALGVQDCASVLADSQRDARRAIEQAEQARREIDRARAEISDAEDDQSDARQRMDAATVARSAAEHAPLIGGTGLEAAAVAAAADAHRDAERDLHAAEARERRARTRLGEAEDDMRRARKNGRIAAEDAEASGTRLQLALGSLPAGALAMAGAPAAGQIAAQGGVPRPQVGDVPISEREPPEHWPGLLKSWYKVGRGEATAISGVLGLGRSAVEHPTEVPDALYGVGKHAVNDPLGTGKQLIGYDELAKGRYEDWFGGVGLAFLAGGGAARTTRLRGGGGRPDAGRAGGTTADDAARATNKAHLIEKAGEGAGLAGAPGGSTIGQLAAHLSHQEVRVLHSAQVRKELFKLEQRFGPNVAPYLAARALSRAVKNAPDDVAARLRELSNAP